MPASAPKIVIIGLGVVGAALADELTLRGCTNVTVFEQGPLYVTGGSSSHAPGFVFQTTPNRTMSLLARRTLDKLDGVVLGEQWLLKRVGGLEIATTPERLHDLRRRRGLAHAWGIPADLIGPEEAGRLWPGLDISLVLGALRTPSDGVVKSVPAVQWQAERAIDRGAQLVPNTRVTGIRREGGRVLGVEVVAVPSAADATPEFVAADIVVSCAGLWGPGLARDLLGFELPMVPMEHGFGMSAPVPSLLGAHTPIEELSRPMLRHQDFSLYLREYVDRIGIGAYNHRPIALEPEAIASADEFHATGVHPAKHPFSLEDFEPTWEETRRLLPELRSVELDEGFNGIFSFTPDGGPMLGPVTGVDGLWLAQAVWVTQSAGVAQVVADWIVNDDPGIATQGLEYTRFDPAVVSHEFSVEQAEESYDEVYDIIHPQQTTLRQRRLRTTPFYDRQVALGAVFESSNGWERPLWYEANAPLVERLETVPTRDPWAAAVWSPIAAAEANATRNAAALYDLSPLPRLEVAGAGATALLQRAVTGKIDRAVGTVTYTLLLDRSGGILGDVTVVRLGDESYLIGSNGNLERLWLESLREGDDGITIREVSGGEGGLGLWGPRARQVLERVTSDDVSNEALPYFRAKRIRIAGAPVLALRVSYVGELGWELYVSADHGRYVWDTLFEAGAELGLIAAGRRAFNALRLEKGYRSFGTDMTREHSPVEAGLGFAVRRTEKRFIGKEALEQRTAPSRLVTLVLDDPSAVVLGNEPVYEPGAAEPIGYVTSADQGYTIGASIAYAWLPAERAAVGSKLEIEYFATRYGAEIRRDPLVDPEGARLRR
ncbi:sarcosine dehydrogenase [Pseudoclavibacter endophyticus]|uniref:FAD-dependent oxidoreductase n=1 Tax=Pseudoclavibacter endophyticus TaxID=1778590 RepID=A0A6H9WT34_9MICO|nr:FAD-dependent oxidoreductase [Pseudoclavibacter endophyticus]KAB1649544.1 FAD-dependent oxidoreductase [Pseudoclavibacter endophyticus]GGA61752.1 sarcosine dehydrogenase [Pseudoclavibacter endophyticus]